MQATPHRSKKETESAVNSSEQLHKNAQMAVRTAVSALAAKGHVEQALRNARHGRIDKTVILDLEQSHAALERCIKHAEQARRRLLRKADRMEAKAE
jgi:hypothetical protein